MARCLGSFKNDGLYLYTDFTISDVVIEYLTNPVKFFRGYDSLEYLQGDTTAYKSARSNCSFKFTGSIS